MKAKELRELTARELEQKLKDSQEKLLGLTSQNVLGQLKNPFQIREMKRDIARIKTILWEYKLKSQQSKESKESRVG